MRLVKHYFHRENGKKIPKIRPIRGKLLDNRPAL